MTPRSKKTVGALIYVTYWLTRDSDPETGVPDARVDVWWSKPVRYAVGERGGFWLDRYSGLTEKHASWTLATAQTFGACPDDSVQCIRVGPESASRDALTIGKVGAA